MAMLISWVTLASVRTTPLGLSHAAQLGHRTVSDLHVCADLTADGLLSSKTEGGLIHSLVQTRGVAVLAFDMTGMGSRCAHHPTTNAGE